MKIKKTNTDLEDFKCPYCNASIEDIDDYYGTYEFDEICPECGEVIKINMTEHSTITYHTRKV